VQGPVPPANLYGYQTKRLKGEGICNLLILKGARIFSKRSKPGKDDSKEKSESKAPALRVWVSISYIVPKG